MGLVIPAYQVDAGSEIASAKCQACSRQSFVLSLVNNFSIFSSEKAKLIWRLEQNTITKKERQGFVFFFFFMSLPFH